MGKEEGGGGCGEEQTRNERMVGMQLTPAFQDTSSSGSPSRPRSSAVCSRRGRSVVGQRTFPSASRRTVSASRSSRLG